MLRTKDWVSMHACIRLELSLIIGGVDTEGRASLWKIDNRGLAQKIDDFPGYACIGSGFILGGNLLLQMFLDPQLQVNVTRGSLFSAFIINLVSRIDPSVGPFEGESVFFDKNGLHSLDPKAVPGIQKEMMDRQRILRNLFLSFDLVGGAERLDKKIKEGLKLLQKEEEKEKKKEKKGV